MEVYCDGACSGNPGNAGLGFVVVEDSKIVAKYSEFIGFATNNIAELLAIKASLLYSFSHNSAPVIYSDSTYAISAITNRTNNVKNKQLIEEIRQIVSGAKFEHVKGHSKNQYNEMADSLAKQAVLMGK